MRMRQVTALGVAVSMAFAISLQPVRAGNRQGSGSIAGIAKDAKKPYEEFKVRGVVMEGPGKGNFTPSVNLDSEAKFLLPNIDPAKYDVQLLNKDDEVVCTEGTFDLTQQPNRTGVVIDCGNPVAWWLLLAAAAAGITAGVVAADDDQASCGTLSTPPCTVGKSAR